MSKRAVRTLEELRELPDKAVIRDSVGDVAERRFGRWRSYDTPPLSDKEQALYLPATVLDEVTS